MDSWQAQYNFWAGFNIPAYEENSVPTGDIRPAYPYITYQAVDSIFDESFYVAASIWTRSTSWELADTLSNTIKAMLSDGGTTVPYDGGMLWVTAEEPFAQNMADPNDPLIKRKRLAVTMHFN